MKVGILTMQYRRNYGGILQSYALMKVLQGMGHDVEIINFHYNARANQHIIYKVTSLFQRVKRLFGKRQNESNRIAVRDLPQEHIQAFERFKRSFMFYTPVVNNDTLGSIANRFDAIVVGSDQIWNDVSGKRLFYFFDWTPLYRGIKVAYAPCSVSDHVPSYNRRKLRRLLLDMDAVSVRDNTTASMVEQVVKMTPTIVLDPTCLYSFDEFVLERLVEGDYIFAYILGSEIECGHDEVIARIKAKYGDMRVVAALIPNISLEVEKFADDIRYNASPAEWVNLIAFAKFVYTDSFHGCMFSIKYHRPFYAYYKDKRRTSRLKDLKEVYSLENIKPSCLAPVISDIDYLRLDAMMNCQKTDSFAFLQQAFQDNK